MVCLEKRKSEVKMRCLKVFIIALVALFTLEAQAAGLGWLSGYTYRKGIIINNSGRADLAGYLIKVENPIYDKAGLVASWPFDSVNSNNETPDASGSGKKAVVYGAALTAGKSGKALSFIGTNNYVDCGNIGPVNSVEFYIDDSNYTNGVLELNPASYVSIANWKITAAGFNSPVIYVNGAKDKPLSKGFNHVVITTDTAIDASAVKIGVAGSDYTNGVIDDVRFYNRVLTASEAARDHKTKVKSDYGDIRFTDSDGVSLLEYWMEKPGVFWVKVPLIPKGNLNKGIYVYYGNGGAESLSDAGIAKEAAKRKPAEPEPTVNIYAEVENL